MKGEYQGNYIDNTSHEELTAWLDLVKKIQPEYVMIYPIERGTPAKNIEKIPAETLQKIAELVNKEGIQSKVYL